MQPASETKRKRRFIHPSLAHSKRSKSKHDYWIPILPVPELELFLPKSLKPLSIPAKTPAATVQTAINELRLKVLGSRIRPPWSASHLPKPALASAKPEHNVLSAKAQAEVSAFRKAANSAMISQCLAKEASSRSVIYSTPSPEAKPKQAPAAAIPNWAATVAAERRAARLTVDPRDFGFVSRFSPVSANDSVSPREVGFAANSSLAPTKAPFVIKSFPANVPVPVRRLAAVRVVYTLFCA